MNNASFFFFSSHSCSCATRSGRSSCLSASRNRERTSSTTAPIRESHKGEYVGKITNHNSLIIIKYPSEIMARSCRAARERLPGMSPFRTFSKPSLFIPPCARHLQETSRTTTKSLFSFLPEPSTPRVPKRINQFIYISTMNRN